MTVPATNSDRYDDAWCQELAAIGVRAIAFVEAECAKASRPCEPADISLVLQSAIIDHLNDDYTRHAHATRTRHDIAVECSRMLGMIGRALIDHGRKMVKRARN